MLKKAMTQAPRPDREKPPEDDFSGMTRLVRSQTDAIETVAQSTRHSSIVRKLRLILPLIAVAIIAIMLVWSDMEKVAEPIKREEIAPQTVGKNELLNPKFQSEDGKSQPYTITADRAFQEAGNLDRVVLQQPVADLSMKNGTWIAVKAKDGEYFQGTQKLHLSGNVRLFHDEGYEIVTEKIDLDVAGQKASSVLPVSGHGPRGTIEGKGLQADGVSNTLTFTGPAKLVITTQRLSSP